MDTNNYIELVMFGKRFFEVLKKANAATGKANIGMRAKNTLKLYTDRLENNDRVLFDNGVSVVNKRDSVLEISYLFRNVWIKMLPHDIIIDTLKPYKGYL